MKIWEDCERTLQAYLESSSSFNADPYCAVVSALVQRGESARQFAHFQSLAVDGALATICPRLASPETFAGLNGTTTCAEFAVEYRKICDAQKACCEGPGHGLVDDWCNGVGTELPPGPPTAAPTPPPPPPSMPPLAPPSPPVIPPDIIAGYVLLAVGGACICAYAVALVCLCCCRKKKPVAARYEAEGEEGAEPAEVEDDIDPLEEFGGMDGDGAASGRDEGATDGFDAGRPASCRSRSPSRVSFGSGNGGGSMRPFPHLEVDVPSNDSLNGDGATLVRVPSAAEVLARVTGSPPPGRSGPLPPVPPSPSHIIGAAPLTVRRDSSPLAGAPPPTVRHGSPLVGAPPPTGAPAPAAGERRCSPAEREALVHYLTERSPGAARPPRPPRPPPSPGY